MKYIRIISDVHGYISKPNPHGRTYLNLIKKADLSIQLGDMGFDYSKLEKVDREKHRMIGGNHDNYDQLSPHFLGDFGYHTLGNFPFFFIRGAFSIDQKWRTPGISWWEEEEISQKAGVECLKLYKEIKPDLVISHECPKICMERGVALNPGKIYNNSTSYLLQQCWETHQPKRWIFGHHHRNWAKQIEGTHFTCMNELCFIDVNKKGVLSHVQ